MQMTLHQMLSAMRLMAVLDAHRGEDGDVDIRAVCVAGAGPIEDLAELIVPGASEMELGDLMERMAEELPRFASETSAYIDGLTPRFEPLVQLLRSLTKTAE